MSKTLEEIRAAKKELEKTLFQLVDNFAKENNIGIENIYFDFYTVQTNSFSRERMLTRVDINCTV